MLEYDAVICGAGPAGLSTGISLLYHKKDAKVIILESREEVSEEKCAEGLSKDWIKHIKGLGKYLLSNLHSKCFENEIIGTDIILPSGEHIIACDKKPNGWVLNKDYFLKNLATIFKKMGGQIELGVNVIGPTMKNNIAYGVETDMEKLVRGKCVIDATGLTQNIWRKALNMKEQLNKDDLEVCFQYKVEGCKIENSEFLQIYFGEHIAPGGYGWVFPKGKNRANVGIGCQASKVENVLPFQEGFWDMLNIGGNIVSKKGGTVSSFNLPKEFVWSNLACVGESARFTNPIHGGGTGPAMFGAYIMGMHIANAIKHNESIEKALLKYQDEIKESRGKAHEYHYRAKRLFQSLNDDEMEIVLSSMKPDEWLKSMSFDKGDILRVIGRIYKKDFKLGLKVTKYMSL
jgi:digeranylgeranylglycerophospholipid reductase